MPANTYDTTPYPSHPYAQSHPNRLETLARLLGLNPQPITDCRVLEIGCASGGNLIPVAYTLPHSEFIGVDYAARQIETGQKAIAELGLKNVRLEHLDILEFPPSLGQFDYIIAHGVYSWTPPAVRDKLLAICKAHLQPQGVAYISYNTYPGWHLMQIIREMMLYHTRHLSDPQEKATHARAALDFLAQSVTTENNPYGHFLKAYAGFLQSELKGVHEKGNAFLLHDELEAVNDPVYFNQFVAHAEQHGLQYLVEADFAAVMLTRFEPEVRQQLQKMAGNIIEVEQYMDFLRNRMFRQTLLCHAEQEINRAVKPDRIAAFYVASRAKTVNEKPDLSDKVIEEFRGYDGATLAIDHALSKAGLVHLTEIWPQVISFPELFLAAQRKLGLEPQALSPGNRDAYLLAANLLRAYSYSSKLAELHRFVPDFVVTLSHKPLASPIARRQAQREQSVTNVWHERVKLDPFRQYLLTLLDGSHTQADLLAHLQARLEDGTIKITAAEDDSEEELNRPPAQILAEDLNLHLRWLAQAALLVG